MSSLPLISHHLFVAAVRPSDEADRNPAPEATEQTSQEAPNLPAESLQEGYAHDEAGNNMKTLVLSRT